MTIKMKWLIVAALFRPGRKRIVSAAVLFIVGIVLVSSGFPTLKKLMNPGAAISRLEEMRSVQQAVGIRVDKAKALTRELEADRVALVRSVKAKSAGDFEAASKDPDVMRLLKELAEIDHLQSVTRDKMEYDVTALDRIESAIRRVARLEKAGELTGEAVSPTELNAIIEEARSPADVGIPSSVESHLERTKLEALYGDVVGQ